MPKQLKNPPEVIWEQIGYNDFIFRDSDHLLRVELMEKGYWWWSVLYKGEDLAFNEPAHTEAVAKLRAEVKYLRHWIESKMKTQR